MSEMKQNDYKPCQDVCAAHLSDMLLESFTARFNACLAVHGFMHAVVHCDAVHEHV